MISIQCICGERYDVDDRYSGRTTQCPVCTSQLQVPAPNGHETTVLPPRRRKKKQPSAKPRARAVPADDYTPAAIDNEEMPGAAVAPLTLLLLINGMQSIRHLMFIGLHFFDDRYTGLLTGPVILALMQAVVAASIAGILLWNRTAVLVAVIAAIVRCLCDGWILKALGSSAILTLVTLITSLLLIRHYRPVAWKRLIRKTTVLS
ncbi:MAG: hypothetical protein R3C20_02630 [Planctomycetaceae bacterium]